MRSREFPKIAQNNAVRWGGRHRRVIGVRGNERKTKKLLAEMGLGVPATEGTRPREGHPLARLVV